MKVLIEKYIKIEFGTSSNEIYCRILKYQSYPENSEEFYIECNEFNGARIKNMNIY